MSVPLAKIPDYHRNTLFEKFHEENAHVYDALVKYAREAKASGMQKAGIRMIWERMRWDLRVTNRVRHAGSEYVLNDHHTSHYARLIMEREADLRGFFDTRERHRT